MNFKNIYLIILLLCVISKVIASPVIKKEVYLSSHNKSNDKINSLGEEVDLNNNVEIIDDDVITTQIIDNDVITTQIIDIDDEECSSEECIQSSKKILSSMDISVNPCDDFYHFTCGGWESKDSEEMDMFSEVNIKTTNEIHTMLESEYTPNEKLSKEDQDYDEKTFKKLKNIYNICKNKEKSESYPNEYLINYIKNFNITENKENLKDPEALTNLFVKLRTHGAELFVGITPMMEQTISDIPIVGMSVSTDYILIYLYHSLINMLPDNIPLYKNYIKTVLTSIYGDKTNIDSIVETIYKINGKISKLIKDNNVYAILYEIQEKQPENAEVLKLNELNEKYPYIHFDTYIKKIFEFFNFSEFINDDMIIYNPYPGYYEGIGKLINEMTVDDIVIYFEWQLIYTVIHLIRPSLNISENLVKTTQEFDNKMNELLLTLSIEEMNEIMGIDVSDLYDVGVDNPSDSNLINKFKKYLGKKVKDNLENEIINEEEENLYLECFSYLDSIMPMAVSKYFIERNFDMNIKDEVKEMIENIKETMINRIQNIEWLDDDTRQHAIKKVLSMKDRIGYLDNIMDPKKVYEKYENIKIDNGFDLTITHFLSKIENDLRTLDENEWLMTPYTVNAYYDFPTNSINFPAALFQTPFYNNNGPDYFNYAISGSIIGHELTHAFDDKGRLFDAEGHYKNWWTDNDDKEFKEYSQCFIDEYNSFKVVIDNKIYNVNGKKTLGENLADNGGLFRAYDAWQLSLLKDPEKAIERNKKLPGFENYTIEQLFYILYGVSNCSNSSRGSIILDSHAPGIARVNGVVTNSKHFAETFNCPTNSPMNPENKCIIW